MWPFSYLSSRPLLILQMLRPFAKKRAFQLHLETCWKISTSCSTLWTKNGQLLVDKLAARVWFLRTIPTTTSMARAGNLLQPWCHPRGSLRGITRGYWSRRSSGPHQSQHHPPRYQGQIPAVTTLLLIIKGTNDPASDKALHDMNGT